MKMIAVGRVCVALASFVFSAAAWSEVGQGSLAGSEKFKVSRCGKEGGPTSVDLSLAANNTFSLVTEGRTYTGTYSGTGNAFTFSLDQASIQQFGDVMAGNASDLCDAAVTVGSVSVRSASLKLNKSHTAAKLKFSATGTGSANGVSGTASFKLKAGGNWGAPS